MSCFSALIRSGHVQRFLCVIAMSLLCACSQADEGSSPANAKEFSLKDYLCVLTPNDCHGQLTQKLFTAPPDAMYERKLGGKSLRIPMAYLDYLELIHDPSQKKDDADLYLVSLLPGIGPRSPQNLREYFMPYERSAIHINVGFRRPGASEWMDVIERGRIGGLNASSTPVRRPDKYDLEIWGEDFKQWPRRLPCSKLGEDTIEKPCGRPSTPDEVYTPLGKRTSLMICDPEALVDRDAQIVAMPEAEREAYFASKQWVGGRRAMCRHQMYYAPLNAHVVLRYPRRFISQWQQTEARVRGLLDSFLVPEQPETKQP